MTEVDTLKQALQSAEEEKRECYSREDRTLKVNAQIKT